MLVPGKEGGSRFGRIVIGVGQEGSVPHPCLAAGAVSVITSSLDRGYLSPAPPQNGSALKPTSPGQRHGNQMTHGSLCIVMENAGFGYVGMKNWDRD